MNRPLLLAAFGLLTLRGCSRSEPPTTDPKPRRPNAIEGSQARTTWSQDNLDYGYYRRAWNVSGREWLSRQTGLVWTGRAWRQTKVLPESNAARRVYAMGPTTLAGVLGATNCGDNALANELAHFYVALFREMTTLEALRVSGTGKDLRRLEGRGEAESRTFGWVQTDSRGRQRVRECSLCNAQGLYPAARLLRYFAEQAPEIRADAAIELSRSYSPFLAKEHLLRLFYDVDWTNPARAQRDSLVGTWDWILSPDARKARPSHGQALFDRDLWLLATTAELLAAHVADPEFVPLSTAQAEQLEAALRLGLEVFDSKGTDHTGVADWNGVSVETRTHFDGDYDDHVEYAYAGHTGAEKPDRNNRSPIAGLSWDIGHVARLPVFLRAIHDTRETLKIETASESDLRLSANQYAYVAFNGDLERPLFSNYFDGHDGWYRVDHGRKQTSHPPSLFCDMRREELPCLTPGAVQGWGLLGFTNSDLVRLCEAIASLATRTDPSSVAHRARYYRYDETEFSIRTEAGEEGHPILLLWLLGASAEHLSGCPVQAANPSSQRPRPENEEGHIGDDHAAAETDDR